MTADPTDNIHLYMTNHCSKEDMDLLVILSSGFHQRLSFNMCKTKKPNSSLKKHWVRPNLCGFPSIYPHKVFVSIIRTHLKAEKECEFGSHYSFTSCKGFRYLRTASAPNHWLLQKLFGSSHLFFKVWLESFSTEFHESINLILIILSLQNNRRQIFFTW